MGKKNIALVVKTIGNAGINITMKGISMNQYRCETCQRRIGLIGGLSDCPIGVPHHCDIGEVYTIGEVGCASHSDFQSELDKVLDDLRKFLLAYSQGLPGFVYVYNVEEWINDEELRQGKDGE